MECEECKKELFLEIIELLLGEGDLYLNRTNKKGTTSQQYTLPTPPPI